ncbi:hypothetical protein [Streptomyces buecherae]|uniref:hypothetical protein n=1 Tax=Streptomyces buecherae TaxID=2763006 RepID=UPI001C27101A|nr:hypothetical protein [Streptomyces buecherae]
MNTGLRTRHHRPKRAVIAVVTGTLLCAAATGCGESSSAADDAPRPARSTPRASAPPAPASPARAVREAARQLRQVTSLRVTLSVETPGASMRASTAALTFKPFSMDREDFAPEESPDVRARKRIVGGVTYTQGSSDGPWVRRGGSPTTNGGWDQLADQALENPMGPSSPPARLDDVRRVGTEPFHGAETTRYRGTLTLAALRAELAHVKDPTQRAHRARRVAEYEARGVRQFTAELWIDADGFARQYVLKGASSAGPMEMVLTYDGINSGFSIDPPPTGS